MSGEDDRKSMDDVLASIRRIVRAEKDPNAEPAADATSAAPEEAPKADPEPSSPTVSPQEPASTDPAPELAPVPEESAPLALTSEMRRDDALPDDGAADTADADEAAADMPDAEPGPPPQSAPTDNAGAALVGAGAAAAAMAGSSMTDDRVSDIGSLPIDRSDIREIVLDVLREEMATGGSASDAIRGIIRDELMAGEIGQNISQNVMTLIQSEVTKALGK